MEYFNKIICVTAEELTQVIDGEPVMSIPNYKQLVARGRISVVRPGKGLGSYALIEYASLPERFRKKFESKYGEPTALIQENWMAESISIDIAARKFFDEYVLPNGMHLPNEKIEEYTLNASVLNELIKMLNERMALRKALGGSTAKLWETIMGTVERFRKNPGHSLPSNPSRLRDKINEYKRVGYACLISRKFGNENTVKITKDAGALIVALKRSRVPVLTNEQIFKEYNCIAAERGWKPLKSVSSLTMYLSRPEIEPLWYDAVYGELAAKQRYGRKHKTQLPQMRDALWYSDGTKLNLYYKDYDGGKLVVKTTQVYEVMDAYSEVLLGYHISDSEDFQSQYRAFRMAIETAEHRPYELVCDNQGGHKKLENSGFLERIARVSRRTAPYNPPSKTIESAFGRFQSQILHKDWRFTGQNITSRGVKSRPNLEFIEANKESLYTLPELKEAYKKARTEWNLSAHPETGLCRMEMYRTSVNPETDMVSQLDMIELFWTMTERPSTFTSSGITIQVNNKEYTYEPLDADGMPDMEFRRNHTGRQFYVRYDPLDMTLVRLYTKMPSGLCYVTDAMPYVQIHRAIQEQQPGEMEFIRHIDYLGKKERVLRQMAAAELETLHGVAPEQHGLRRPRIKGLSNKAAESLMMECTTEAPAAKTEPVEIGMIEKLNSNRTFDQTAAYDKF